VHLEMGLLRLINAARLAPLEELLAEMKSAARAASRIPEWPRGLPRCCVHIIYKERGAECCKRCLHAAEARNENTFLFLVYHKCICACEQSALQ